MHPIRSILFLSLCQYVAFSAHAALILTTEQYVPFSMQDTADKAPSGIAVDKMAELMHRAGEVYEIQFYPWARALRMAEKNPDTCVFSAFRSREREAAFRWIGPLLYVDDAIFSRTNDVRKPRGLSDLKPYTLGGYNNDAVGDYLKRKGYKVDLADNDLQNPQKLLHEHIDFWATGAAAGKYMIKNAGLGDQIVFLFNFQHSPLYLACNRAIDPARAEKFNRILKEMDQDGTSLMIEKKYQ